MSCVCVCVCERERESTSEESQVAHLQHFNLVCLPSHEDGCARQRLLQVLGSNLHSLGGNDGLVVDVRILYSQLAEGLGHQKGTHLQCTCMCVKFEVENNFF